MAERGSCLLEKIDGFIIKEQDYGETNKIVTIFSKKLGKFNCLARGAKKPRSRMAAVTQPFVFSRFFVYVNSGLSTIRQGEVLDSFRPVREDIFKTAYASFIAELTDKLLDAKQPDGFLFTQYYETMEWIAENKDGRIPVMMYEMKLYRKAGIAPIVNHCLHCGSKERPFFFSVANGGLLCGQCKHMDQDAVFLPDNLSKLLYIFSEVSLEQVGSISVKEQNIKLLRKILDAYYDQYGGFYLKSRRFLKQMEKLE